MDLDNLDSALSVVQSEMDSLSSFITPSDKFDLTAQNFLGKLANIKAIVPEEMQNSLQQILKTEEEIKEIEKRMPTEAHPLLLQDRENANKIVNALTSKIESVIEKYKKEQREKPICPYKGTLQEYLGKNYKVPTIHELPLPDLRTFSLDQAKVATIKIFQKIEEKGLVALKLLAAEAASKDGIQTQALGHAFSTIVETPSGTEITIDKEKTAKFLLFIETIRNTPQDYILENPKMFALKVFQGWCDVHKDISNEVLALSSVESKYLEYTQQNPAPLLLENKFLFEEAFQTSIKREQIKV